MNGIHAGGLGRVRFFMPSGGYKNSCPREATKIHALEQALGHEFLVAALGHEKPYTPSTPGMKETFKAPSKSTVEENTAEKHSNMKYALSNS